MDTIREAADLVENRTVLDFRQAGFCCRGFELEYILRRSSDSQNRNCPLALFEALDMVTNGIARMGHCYVQGIEFRKRFIKSSGEHAGRFTVNVCLHRQDGRDAD